MSGSTTGKQQPNVLMIVVDCLQGCHRAEGIVLGAGPAFAPGNSVQGDLGYLE